MSPMRMDGYENNGLLEQLFPGKRRSICPSPDIKAAEIFKRFCKADSATETISFFNELQERVKGIGDSLVDSRFPYQYLKPFIDSKIAQDLLGILDSRSVQPEYNDGEICQGKKVLVVGAGPCGLRFAIEARLLGAEVVVLEKRSEFTRNNVIHLWPYVITDLKKIGVKLLYPRFAVGGLDHIGIRRLQITLLKIALLLGVEIYIGTSFEGVIEPTPKSEDCPAGWRVSVNLSSCPVTNSNFDVLIGADGRRNCLPEFEKREFRGKFAIAITCNFVNHRTREEARVREVGGIAQCYFLQLFNELRATKNINLENFVYFKGETHYVVMTASKESLLIKGVLLKDYSSSAELLAPKNTDFDKLVEYTKEAVSFVTDLPKLDIVMNHQGQPDIAMFDFTSMFAARNSCHLKEKHGKRLLMALVGDSLLEPFWPLGTGCARGFLSVFDAAWMMKHTFLKERPPVQILKDRENLYKLLAQTSPSTLKKQFTNYTIDPSTRYLSIHTCSKPIPEDHVKRLYDSDELVCDTDTLGDVSTIPVDHVKRLYDSDELVCDTDTLGDVSTIPVDHVKRLYDSDELVCDTDTLGDVSTIPVDHVKRLYDSEELVCDTDTLGDVSTIPEDHVKRLYDSDELVCDTDTLGDVSTIPVDHVKRLYDSDELVCDTDTLGDVSTIPVDHVKRLYDSDELVCDTDTLGDVSTIPGDHVKRLYDSDELVCDTDTLGDMSTIPVDHVKRLYDSDELVCDTDTLGDVSTIPGDHVKRLYDSDELVCDTDTLGDMSTIPVDHVKRLYDSDELVCDTDTLGDVSTIHVDHVKRLYDSDELVCDTDTLSDVSTIHRDHVKRLYDSDELVCDTDTLSDVSTIHRDHVKRLYDSDELVCDTDTLGDVSTIPGDHVKRLYDSDELVCDTDTLGDVSTIPGDHVNRLCDSDELVCDTDTLGDVSTIPGDHVKRLYDSDELVCDTDTLGDVSTMPRDYTDT